MKWVYRANYIFNLSTFLTVRPSHWDACFRITWVVLTQKFLGRVWGSAI